MKNMFSGIFILISLLMMKAYAGSPLWTFTPVTGTNISVPNNGTAMVQYLVTNQSASTHTLVMNPIVGVEQIANSPGFCGNPFTLPGKGVCVLNLQVYGNQVAEGNTNGPVVCDQGNQLQCYRPSSTDTLKVTKTESQYTVGGMISGLALTNTVYLQNNGIDSQPFIDNGIFTFMAPFTNGSPYNITVSIQPTNQTCSVSNGTGTVAAANVTNVMVTCADNAYTVGGTVSGLSGTVILLNNSSDPAPISSNGNFTFSTPVAEGASYNVTVGTQPAGQTCTVMNGSGTMGGSNVTNVSVNCTNNTTTLSTSVSTLALKTNGTARTITVTNTGSSIAENVSINYPVWPVGTSANSTCATTLSPGSSCTITVTPGANTTSNCNAGTGSAPTPGGITVNASNATSSVTTNVVVLAYECIYQQGYLFSIDDTTPSNLSIGGTVTALADNSSAIQWYNGVDSITNAQSLTDGAANTAAIILEQSSGTYAASICANYTIDSMGNTPCSSGTCYTSWYLPAICQMGAAGEGAGCAPGIQNMSSNLPALITSCSGAQCLSGGHWSSTESSVSPDTFAQLEDFLSGGSSYQGVSAKSGGVAARCVRELT